MKLLGWLGAVFLAFCGMPQAIKSVKDGHAYGLDRKFLLLWTGGEIFTLIAVLGDIPVKYLIFNYGMNLIFLLVIWFYKIFPRRKK